jgi:signal transduction histidine kinase
MTSPKTNGEALATPENSESLRMTLETWNKEKLVEQVLAMSQTLAEEQEAVKKITSRYDATQSWALGLALVEEIGQNLASTLDLNEVLTRLLTRVHNALEVEDGSILLIEEPSGDLVSQVVLGVLSARVTKHFRVPKGQGIAGEVAESGVPIIVNDAKNDPRHFTKIDEDTGFETRSILCVPILTHEKILGVLEVFNKKSGPFTPQDQILLGSIANYAGIAIENARLHQNVVEERDRVLHAQQEISHKLQRDLHDGPTQLVAAIQMGLDFSKKAMQHNARDMVKSELNNMHELASRASHQMRTLLFELRPLILETKGLVPALRMFLERRQKENEQVKLHLSVHSDQARDRISRLEDKVETAIFEIVQETVNNAIKHAEAQNIRVKLEQISPRLTVTIVDDGKGFDVKQALDSVASRSSYGMVNLRERVAIANGEYTINSAPGQGTKIRVTVPLSQGSPKT